MAIGNYAELRTAVANWMDRDDLTDRIPEFIALAEARLNRNLRIRAMESKQVADTVAGQRNYALPTRYIQMRNMQINKGDRIVPLQYITPEIYDRTYSSPSTGTPIAYTILADEIQLGKVPSGVFQMEMTFYQSWLPLSATNTTNWLLTNAPDIYLYGALLEAEPFIMNDPRVQLWLGTFNTSVADLQMQDNKDRHSGSAMRVMSD